MKTSRKVRKSLLVASTGVFAGALAVSAAVQVIQPPPSDFIDTEASTNLVFAPLQEDTRHYRLKFSGDFSPSNDLEVAFGGDANGDGDLSPEETEARFGVDCGEKKSKSECPPSEASCAAGAMRGVEVEQWNLSTCSAGQPEQEGDILCSPSPSTFTYSSPSPTTFTLKLTKAVSRRWNLMKVTRRGFFSAEPTVKLKPRKPGMMIIVR